MSDRNFMELLKAKWDEGKFVCVGLDSDFSIIPASVINRFGHDPRIAEAAVIETFNIEIVQATQDLVCAYKPNIAFYEAYGVQGILALEDTIEHIHQLAPDVPVILDAKRADIGNTSEAYAQAAFDVLDADAITVNPYLGAEALRPFLDRADKGVFVLCRTSNPGAGEFQDLDAGRVIEKLDRRVARQVASSWNENGNCGIVVGGTHPYELRRIRNVVGDLPILMPGIGAQGGDLLGTVLCGKNNQEQGMIINASRSIIFASDGPDFAEAARHQTQKLHGQIKYVLEFNYYIKQDRGG